MPALLKSDYFEYSGVGHYTSSEIENISDKEDIEQRVKNNREKALNFMNNFGGKLYESYHDAIEDKQVSSIYIPLPPQLHYKYAMQSLSNGKHVLLEKPATLSYKEISSLVDLAKTNNLALHENYMFIFHSQLAIIKEYIESGYIGNIRLYRISFGFPFRGKRDFRYNKSLGGGALFDVGGYTIKLATLLLGKSTIIDSAISNFADEFDVDLYGHGVLTNNENQVAHISFGMDNDYKCELEVWGSTGTLYTNRIFTAPINYNPIIKITKNGNIEETKLDSDDTFFKSLTHFKNCIVDKKIRECNYDEILFQSKLIEDFKIKAGIEW